MALPKPTMRSKRHAGFPIVPPPIGSSSAPRLKSMTTISHLNAKDITVGASSVSSDSTHVRASGFSCISASLHQSQRRKRVRLRKSMHLPQISAKKSFIARGSSPAKRRKTTAEIMLRLTSERLPFSRICTVLAQKEHRCITTPVLNFKRVKGTNDGGIDKQRCSNLPIYESYAWLIMRINTLLQTPCPARIPYFLPSLIAACAAARRAIGTRKGEQET